MLNLRLACVVFRSPPIHSFALLAESRQKKQVRLEFASRWRETRLRMAAVAGFQRSVLRRLSEDVDAHMAWEHLSRQRTASAFGAWRGAAASYVYGRRMQRALYASALLARAFASMLLHARLPLRAACAHRLRRERRRQVCVLLSWRLAACRRRANAAAPVAAAIASLLSEAAHVTSSSGAQTIDPEERTLSRYWLGPCQTNSDPVATENDGVTFWQGQRTNHRAQNHGDFYS